MIDRTALNINGHTLFYEEHSRGEEIFIFVHGVTGSLGNWAGFLEPFKARGRVIVLNLPGHYPATFPPNYDESQITAEAWGDLGGQAIDQLTGGQPVTMLGHSTGGFLTLATAWRAPELIQRAVSISGFAQGRWHGLLGVHQCGLLALGPLYQAWFGASYRMTTFNDPVFHLAWRIYGEGLRTPFDRTAVQQAAASSRGDFCRLDMASIAKVFRAMRNHIDMRGYLREIQSPVLAVTGDHDPIVPPYHAETIAAGVPDGTLALIPGGHVAHIESRAAAHHAIFSWLDAQRSKKRPPIGAQTIGSSG